MKFEPKDIPDSASDPYRQKQEMNQSSANPAASLSTEPMSCGCSLTHITIDDF